MKGSDHYDEVSYAKHGSRHGLLIIGLYCDCPGEITSFGHFYALNEV